MLITSALNKLVQAVFASSIGTSHYSSTIQYNVVSLVGQDQTLGVLVDNQIYPLNISNESSLLYSGNAPVAHTGYKYVILTNDGRDILQRENFTRLPVLEDKTYYEHYNRTWNVMKMDSLPNILEPLSFIHRVEKDPHFDGQIPTIHITGNQSAIDFIHKNPREDIKVGMNITYISPTVIKQYENVALSIAGHSTRSQAKLSYKFKLPKKTDLYNFRYFKLRSMATDPSYMRDELAYDIANRIGMPTSKYSYARVYINNRAIGLFGLAEVFRSHWIENEFGNGQKKFKHGAFYVADVSAGRSLRGNPDGPKDPPGKDPNAPPGGPGKGPNGPPGGGMTRFGLCDLSYLGDNVTLYSIVYPPKENANKGNANFTRIMDITKFISEQPHTYSPDNSAVVPLWEQKIDVDSFLRGLAHEIVTSNSDGYFTMANNYILYDDLTTERIVFSGQDFDLSMGSTMFNATLMNSGNYSEFPGVLERPLTSRLLKVPQFRQDFEKLLVYITKNLVNLSVLAPRINQLSTMLAEDVAWDKTLPRVAEGGRRPGGMPTTDISFADAVNGTLRDDTSADFRALLSLKEWIQLRSNNLLLFFNASHPSVEEEKKA